MYITKDIPILFRADALGLLFLTLTAFMWVMDLIFSIEYMKDQAHKRRYYFFYALTLVSMLGVCLAGNLITMYVCYEFMSLVSLPLVLHEQDPEAIAAGRKYIFYSIGGAFLGLSGFFFIYTYGTTLTFTPGGVLDPELLAGHEGAMLLVTMLVIIGFGSKAGMFPLHAWLPTA
ncbi:MAG: proton-conducting membrane transporter, partial [Lachnospiraceae bacterium]|nr:proton-conducting membrane transporter [Lachnospiraceae bacterium]